MADTRVSRLMRRTVQRSEWSNVDTRDTGPCEALLTEMNAALHR